MTYSPGIFMRSTMRKASLALVVMMVLTGTVFWATTDVSANHPVFIEGNCLGTTPVPDMANPPARTIVPPGTCGDYDGDGRIGTAEDDDEVDRVFGTINAAIGNIVPPATAPRPGSANQNSRVTIVTSGVFTEVVNITCANGNVTLQAGPGVEANIDAVRQGDLNSGVRQGAPGIIVNCPNTRYVMIRNVTSRNWTSGIRVLGNSRVAIENTRIENNTNFGIEIRDNARVTIAKSEVHGTGFRMGATAETGFPTANQPMPGTGIQFADQSSGTVFLTTVSGSFASGIANVGRNNAVCAYLVNVFDNRRNFDGVRRSSSSAPCENVRKDDDKDSDRESN